MPDPLTVLRNIYRSEWGGQSNFGPKHTTVLSGWKASGALAIGGNPRDPLFAFHHKCVRRHKELTMFTNGDAPFAWRQQDDLIVDAVLVRSARAVAPIATKIDALSRGRPLWLELLPQDGRQRRVAERLRAIRLGTRFTSESEVLAVWYRGSATLGHVSTGRRIPVEPIQRLVVVRLPIRLPRALTTALREECQQVAEAKAMAQHYSKKNRGRRWSALSLYGFSMDPRGIAKPSEVSDRKNPPVRATTLLRQHPKLKNLVDDVVGRISANIVTERVRLMRLARADSIHSEVERHSDLTDREHGVDDGRLVRLHMPIVTNPGATVSVWDEDNRERRTHLPAGAWYYLDVRRPHRVLNVGQTDRLHLVADCRASDALRMLIAAGEILRCQILD